mmetsp:Transcript_3062/g.11130  ORF Transcript_3062/g.11130 Transcript_3062/m.11130 type:complete len:271 (+) Transcript_3062:1756-2568(+)
MDAPAGAQGALFVARVAVHPVTARERTFRRRPHPQAHVLLPAVVADAEAARAARELARCRPPRHELAGAELAGGEPHEARDGFAGGGSGGGGGGGGAAHRLARGERKGSLSARGWVQSATAAQACEHAPAVGGAATARRSDGRTPSVRDRARALAQRHSGDDERGQRRERLRVLEPGSGAQSHVGAAARDISADADGGGGGGGARGARARPTSPGDGDPRGAHPPPRADGVQEPEGQGRAAAAKPARRRRWSFVAESHRARTGAERARSD